MHVRSVFRTGLPATYPDFHPHPMLRHPHLMTVVPRLWPRPPLPAEIPTTTRLFAVSPDTQLLAYCHWQPEPLRCKTVVLLHGLEGCSKSHYMLGLAAKAWKAGLNVLRLNQRNCGESLLLTPTLYNSGLSGDLKAVLEELHAQDRLPAIWFIGYSMGGNLVLKLAGEVGATQPALRGILAVCPNIDPGACVAALEQPGNGFYQRYFLKRLKRKLQRKAELFPGKFDVQPLRGIRTLREFDEVYTAPDGGYRSAEDYYDRSGSRHVLAGIEVPTLILTAQNDPFIPIQMFQAPSLTGNARIRLWAPRHGGHCGFFQRQRVDEDSYWAENRLVDWVVDGEAAA